MTHLRIEQNNIQENVSGAVIEKLYELATSGDLDLSSNLAGNLHTTATYLEYIDALCKTLLNPNGMFPDLTISATDIYIMFEDPEVLNVLLANNIGDGVGVTLALAANANLGSMFYQNTTITSFDNFDKFTYANSHETSFRGCTNLRSINLSNNTILAQNGFKDCTSLISVNIGGGNGSTYGVFEGCTSLLSVTLPSSYTTLRENFFGGCSNLTTINLSNILTLRQYAFAGCSKLTTADLSSCTSLSYESFSGCTSLATVTLSPQLTSIGLGTFKNCSSLSSIDLSHITSIGGANGYGAFQGCSSLTSVTLNSAITKLLYNCFHNCTSLTTISGLNNITELEPYVFLNCNNLTTTDIDWTKVTSIGSQAFLLCSSLTGTVNLSNVTSLGDYVFDQTSITSLSIGNGITGIPNRFCSYNTHLTSVTIPSTVTSIGNEAFDGCTNLTSFDFTNINYIGTRSFRNTGITIVNLNNTITTIDGYAFDNTPVLYLHVPGTVTTLGNFVCTNYGCHYKIDEGVTSIGSQTFKANRLILPSTITSIGNLNYGPNTLEFLVIKATTPPTYSSNCFLSNFYYPIYVPDNSVAAYKAQPGGNGGYTAWTDRVKSFTDFANDYPGISLNGTGYATDPV